MLFEEKKSKKKGAYKIYKTKDDKNIKNQEKKKRKQNENETKEKQMHNIATQLWVK